MKTFLTEYDPKYAGPDIEADTWEDARVKAAILGVKVVGILDSRYQEQDTQG